MAIATGREKPRGIVAALYERWPQPGTFAGDLAAHRATGHVVDTPEFFLMEMRQP